MKNGPIKLFFLVTEDWFFCSHFIERAVAAKEAGYDVVVMTHIDQHADIIRARGLRLIPLALDRRSTNPLKEIKVIAQIYRAYKAERPDIVHHVALKPVLYGSVAARIAGVPAVVNAPVGMGYIFISSSIKAALLRLPVRLWLRLFLSPHQSRVIFENGDDLAAFVAAGYVPQARTALIRGAGIDFKAYVPSLEPAGDVVVMLTARMLWDKGIGEFVEAARIIKQTGSKAKFVLVGAPDKLNHAAIDEKTLHGWQAEGVIDWLGHRTDVATLLKSCHIVCLPSYREGLPKSLLEGLASGKPIVTTDVVGCRETVRDGENGFLVPARDAKALAKALLVLINDPGMRKEMGTLGRQRAENEFSQERVISETLAVYRQLV